MIDPTTAPGFFDYVLAYEAQGMSKEQAINKAHEKFFGTDRESGGNDAQRRRATECIPSRPIMPPARETATVAGSGNSLAENVHRVPSRILYTGPKTNLAAPPLPTTSE